MLDFLMSVFVICMLLAVLVFGAFWFAIIALLLFPVLLVGIVLAVWFSEEEAV